MDLAKWVKTERLRQKWSQQALADKAGLERTEIIAIEKGRNQGSTERVRAGLRRAFGGPIHGDTGGANDAAATPAGPTAPVMKNRPEWGAVRAEAIESNPALRERPELVDAIGETGGLDVQSPLQARTVASAALWLLEHGSAALLERVEAARVERLVDAERALEREAEKIAKATKRPVHQALAELRARRRGPRSA